MCSHRGLKIEVAAWPCTTTSWTYLLGHLTSTGFRRKMKKFSALIIMNRMNLWHRIFSISSACRRERTPLRAYSKLPSPFTQKAHTLQSVSFTCFTAILTRTELMDPSIRTFSFSFLLIITGCNSSSLLLLQTNERQDTSIPERQDADGQAHLASLSLSF